MNSLMSRLARLTGRILGMGALALAFVVLPVPGSSAAAAVKATPTPSRSTSSTGAPTATPTTATSEASLAKPGATPTPTVRQRIEKVTATPTSGPPTTATPAASSTPIPTGQAITSVTATSTSASIALMSISPRTVSNDRPAKLTLAGLNFVDGMKVAIEDQALENVKLQSTTSLSATLPAGLCPGAYQATLTDNLGRQISGGELLVEGVRTAAVSGSAASAAVQLSGRGERLSVPLPRILVEDTTCAGDFWQLSFAVGEFTHSTANRPPLKPRAVQLDLPGAAWPAAAALRRTNGPVEATLLVQRSAGQRSITLSPSIELEIPASAYAGQYTAAVTVTIASSP
jgi:hypothetical protein